MTHINFFVKYLLACYLFTCVSALTLPYLTTRKPRVTKYMTTTPSSTQYPGSIESLQVAASTTTTEAPTSAVLYRVNANNGATCILIRTDALISIQYTSTDGEVKEGDAFVPENAQVTGDCDSNEDEAIMTIAWPGFALNFKFEKTPGGERWYLDKVDLSFDTENRIFEHMIDRKHSKYIRLSTSEEHSAMLFPTPVGKSYTCSDEKTVTLRPANEKAAYFKGILYLRQLRVQPFMYKSTNDFGPQFPCSIAGYMRDETAPIAVGSTLAIAVLGTITGYGLFRYFKIKKVQYNTME